MASLQHFSLPFRFGASLHAAVVEQDSDTDIVGCVNAALRTPIGTRLYVPGFGITDPTFAEQPLDLQALQAQIQASEPRAHLSTTQAVADLVSSINVEVGTLGQ